MRVCHNWSEQAMESILVVIVAIVIAAIIVGGFVMRRRRAKQTEAFAQERGWRYEKSDATVLSAYPQVFPFYAEGRSTSKPGISLGGSGRSDDAQNVMYLNVGDYPGHSFTYNYSTRDTDSDGDTSTKQHYWHVLGVELPVPFPHLTIRRRRKLDALENRLTKPVELPHPGLSAAYTIHSEHPPAAFDVVTPEMAQWLLAQQFKTEMVLQDTRLFVYAKGKQKLENIEPMVAQLAGFLSQIPAVAWQKAQGEYPRPQRTLMVDSLDLNKMKDAYTQWRDSQG